MMDIVLGAAAGLILAVVLSNPPREKPRVTATVVEPEAKAARTPPASRKRK